MKKFLMLGMIPLAVSISLSYCSCSTVKSTDNAIYYWRTTLTLNDAEREYLSRHDVSKIYLRYFDVDKQYDGSYNAITQPVATLSFVDQIPDSIEVVPVVYITTSAMEDMGRNVDELAEKIVRRVNAISIANNLRYNELQLDCDWTNSTRPAFFALCENVKRLLDPSQKLSATIRLHQLTQTPPPVDKGVLMVYNTGNFTNSKAENSIFSADDIKPYLADNRLAEYDLPLDVAYPAYGWSLVYRSDYDGDYSFYRILRQTEFPDSLPLEKLDKNRYRVTDRMTIGGSVLFKDYIIRVEIPTSSEVLDIKQRIDRQLKGKPHQNIIYHLDSKQLSNYSDNEIDKIYSRD